MQASVGNLLVNDAEIRGGGRGEVCAFVREITGSVLYDGRVDTENSNSHITLTNTRFILFVFILKQQQYLTYDFQVFRQR